MRGKSKTGISEKELVILLLLPPSSPPSAEKLLSIQPSLKPYSSQLLLCNHCRKQLFNPKNSEYKPLSASVLQQFIELQAPFEQ